MSVSSPALAAPSGPKVVLSGYYGFDNLGDEALLEALVEQLRALRPGLRLVALSHRPAATAEALGIEAVARLSPWGLLRALWGARLFISGGGSLLQDVTGLGSIPYYLGLVAFAQGLGVPTAMVGQGLGPLQRGWSRRLVGAVARRAGAIALRDPASQALMVRCGVPEGQVALTMDPVLGLAPAASVLGEAALRRAGLDPSRPWIAIAVRPWAGWFERQLKAFSAVLAQRARAWGTQVLLLPFHRPDDVWLAEELEACLAARPEGARPEVAVLHEALRPREMLALLQGAQLVVGMRLHALIMAAAVGVPGLALVYDPKVAAFAELAGYPSVPDLGSLDDVGAWERTLDAAWAGRAQQRSHLEAHLPHWQAMARRNAELALSVLAEGRPA